jgi:AmpD protein
MDYTFIQANSYWSEWKRDPILIVIHWTAGNFKSAIETFKQGKASAHFVVDKNGDSVQMVQLNDRAWHAGISSSKFGVNVNNYSFGIELVGPPSLIAERKWHTEQLFEAANICKYIASKYPTVKFITDHSTISPGRKIDVKGGTGIDLFPWTEFVQMTGLEDLK